MKKVIVGLSLILLNQSAFAYEVCGQAPTVCHANPQLTKSCGCPLPKKKATTTPQKPSTVITNTTTNTTTNNTVTIVQPQQHRQTRPVVIREAQRKTSISLVGMMTPNKLTTSYTSTTYTANNSYQPDVGLMLQRDFSDAIRGTLGATVRGNAWLGLGYNF